MDESNVLGGWEEAADAENAAIDAVAHSEEQHDRVGVPPLSKLHSPQQSTAHPQAENS